MVVAERYCICNSDKYSRELNHCKLLNGNFYSNVNPAFKRVRPDDNYYMCRKDFQLLERLLKVVKLLDQTVYLLVNLVHLTLKHLLYDQLIFSSTDFVHKRR